MSTAEILSLLKQKGYRITMARRIIISLITTTTKPFSVADVLHALSKEPVQPNRVTIYRELAFLEREGIVESVMLNNGIKHYCSGMQHHHHLICTKCETVIDADMTCDVLKGIEEQLSRKNAFHITKHSLDFYGLCSHCSL